MCVYIVYIPKDKLNNIEKNIYSIHESFYYPSNLNALLLFLEAKYTKILSSGLQQGMTVNKESERELMHRLLLEGIPFYISSLLKTKLKQYEESISEQPMLLAHPSSVNDKSMLNFIPKQNIEEIIKSNYTVIPNKIYTDLPQYELYSQFRYLYMQGEFEDESIKDNNHRSDFIFNFHINYFEKSKHKLITKLTHCLYALPFELNNNYPMFQCQVNDYVQCSYFRENFSYINTNYDSSFTHDTGKKFTYMVVLFPDEVELNKRILNIKLHDNDNNKSVYDIKLTEPLSAVLIKSRRIGYEIPKHTFPFILMFYYIHGPIDKDNFTC